MRPGLLVLAPVLALVPVCTSSTTAHAQSDTVSRLPITRCTVPRADTSTGFVYGSLVSEDREDRMDRQRLSTALARLAAAMMDDTVTLGPVTRMHDVVITRVGGRAEPRKSAPLLPRWPGHPALATEIVMDVDSAGIARDPRFVIAGDSAVAALLDRAIGTSRAAAGDTRARNTERVRLRLSLRPDSSAVSMPIVTARQIILEGTGPRQHAGSGAPHYPARVGDPFERATVLAWYVVGADGAVVPSSFGAASPADRSRSRVYDHFVTAVREGVLRMRHEPARLGGCPAPHLGVVQMEFTFEPRR